MLIFFVFSIFSGLIFSLLFANIGMLFMFVFGFIIVFVSSRKLDKKIIYHNAFILALILIFSLITYYSFINLYGVPYMDGWNDDAKFETAMQFLLNSDIKFPWELSGVYLPNGNNSKGYVLFLSWISRFSNLIGVQYHTFMPRIINSFMIISIANLMLKYIKNNYSFNCKAQLTFVYLFSLFPNTIFITVHVFRDVFVLFLIILTISIWDTYLHRKKPKILFLIPLITVSSILLYYIYFTRLEAIYIVIFLLLILLIVRERIKILSLLKFIAPVILIVAVLQFTDFFNILTLRYLGYTEYRIEHSDGLSNFIFSQPLIPFGIIFRIGYGLISPFPASIFSIFSMFKDINYFYKVFVAFGSVFQILLLPFLFSALKKLDKTGLMFLLVLFGITLTTFTFRHFIMLYPFLFTLTLKELFNMKTQKVLYLVFSMMFISVLLLALYVLIK
jgi:hypothetical protein